MIFIISSGIKINSDSENRTFLLTSKESVQNINDVKEEIFELISDERINNIVIIISEDIVASVKHDYRIVTMGKSLDRERYDEAVIGETYAEEFNIGDEIEIFGKTYTVVGVSLLSDKVEINYESVHIDMELIGIEIIVNYASDIKIVRNQIKNSELAEFFIIKEPEKKTVFDVLANQIFLYIFGGVLILTLIAYVLSLSFIYNQQRNIFNVYRITGGSRKFIFFTLNLILMLLIAVIGIGGSILFYFVDLLFLRGTYSMVFMSDYILSFFDYLYVFALYLLTGVIFSPLLYRKMYWRIKRKAQ
jgi:hypothetical protein